MRARLPATSKVSTKQREAIKELVAEELKKQREDTTRRIMKMYCATLNEQFGFGKDRLYKLVGKVLEMLQEHEDDEIFWVKMDRKLHQVGLDFKDEEWEL
jgi:hypothetical protein